MTNTIRLAELIEALSHALDMTEGQPAGRAPGLAHPTMLGARPGR